MSFQNLAIFIILLSGCCLAISAAAAAAAGARGSKNQTVDEQRSSQLTLSRIEINEEMDAGLLVVNLTALIRNETNHTVDSIKFDNPMQRSGQFHLSDYFQIETKRVRSQPNTTASNTTNIVLRTSGKKLDREYLCRLSSLKSECSCEYDCIVWLDLTVVHR